MEPKTEAGRALFAAIADDLEEQEGMTAESVAAAERFAVRIHAIETEARQQALDEVEAAVGRLRGHISYDFEFYPNADGDRLEYDEVLAAIAALRGGSPNAD
jgi:hypothetical protein